MIEYNTVKNDLNDIRFFYSRKDSFDTGSKTIGPSAVLDKISKYNDVVRKAPARIYEFYVSLYLNNNTLESLAFKLGYSYIQVQRMNKNLITYLQNNLELEEKGYDEKKSTRFYDRCN